MKMLFEIGGVFLTAKCPNPSEAAMKIAVLVVEDETTFVEDRYGLANALDYTRENLDAAIVECTLIDLGII